MSRRTKFRELVDDRDLLVMPGAYDGLSARIIEAEGFHALVAGGYAAIGSMMGEPDGGQSNMRDMVDHYARIVGAVEIPVYVDADTGFGGVHNVAKAVRALEATGAAGLFFSDQVFPNRCGYLPGKQVVPVEIMLSRIAAALDARTDERFFIGTRTDCLSLTGLDDAIERCQMFVEAGVDMAKPQGADTREQITRSMAEIPGPHFATLSQAAGEHPAGLEGMREIGVAAVTMPSISLFAAAQGVRKAIAKLAATGSTADLADQLMPLPEYYELVRLGEFQSREKSYDDRAADILARRNSPRT
ncbi:2-Methylisocitrate lyase, PEP mutase family [Hyphomicrobiales bacterium]|nr:2-Methylisocitrate lyase, PEP mutase family [Hyphomicrobiales bacterium]CAH1676691.1 2-Methylisocitrate lyase, PEP mutase family [Hyphomicrobiales bacterium]